MTQEGLAGAWDALREGRCEEALGTFEVAAGRDPEDASAHEGLGLARRDGAMHLTCTQGGDDDAFRAALYSIRAAE